MTKYLLGSAAVLIIAFYLVNYGMNKTKMADTVNSAMDVPYGEYQGMDIKQDGDQYALRMKKMSLFSTRNKNAVMCTADIKLLFDKEKDAKLVMKFRYNIGPFLAKPLRGMSPERAMTDAGKQKMINSLRDGYAHQYGIKTISGVEFSGLNCGISK